MLSTYFTREDGASVIKLPGSIKVDTASGAFYVDLNSHNEMALIRMRIEARVRPSENKVYDAVAVFSDHLSYAAQTPLLTGQMKIYDERNQITTIDMIGPEREVALSQGEQRLFIQLSPIYALYREFRIQAARTIACFACSKLWKESLVSCGGRDGKRRGRSAFRSRCRRRRSPIILISPTACAISWGSR